ncbi:thioredoxin family protein [Pedobacter insulae]|uniref:Thioredoxin n=1 Tax=Pedobacter insulae TaxID=414048 RepID=A0A1I2UM39_9SPHI|nr:thioredoxin family protein [Pedobacter insulae]SFG77369.1 Thioredoxin [Pedobacter insulae]
MKSIISAILLLFAMNTSAQEFNKKVQDQYRNQEVLLNSCTREGLTTFPEFKAGYDSYYAAYKPDSVVLSELTKLVKGKKMTIVLGTWCGDSKYQVPNFLKVADALKLSENDITFLAVDGAKKTENGLIDKLKIERVPTFIFTDKSGTEIGRITERPHETLEKDMLIALSTKPALPGKPEKKF